MDSRQLKIGDQSVYVAQQGTGKDIVLVHGLFEDTALWTSLFEALGEYRLTAYDLRSHGLTVSNPASDHSSSQYAKDLEDLIRILKLKPILLIGHSWGGVVLQRYGQMYGARNILLCNTSPTPPEMFQQDPRALKALGYSDFMKIEQAYSSALMQDLETTPQDNPAQSAANAHLMMNLMMVHRNTLTLQALRNGDFYTFDFEKANKWISSRVGIVTGTRDEIISRDQSQALIRSIPGSVVYSLETGHIPMQKLAFIDSVKEFLEGCI